MKKNHKILVSIGIILLVVVTAVVVFQVDKTNKTLAYNKQQQEIKMAQEKKIAFDKLEAEQLAKQLEAEPIEKKAVDQAWDLIWNKAGKLMPLDHQGKAPYYKQAEEIVKDYPKFISKYKEDAHALYVKCKVNVLVSAYWSNKNDKDGYDASGKYDNYETYNRNFEDSNKLTVAALIKDLNPNEVGSGSENMRTTMSSLKTGLNNILGVSEAEWKKIYSAREADWDSPIKTETKYYEELKNSIPKIGMTREEVIITKWGRPNKVNKTTTANGVSEQWVYGSNRYVYLDNGIVTAIQD